MKSIHGVLLMTLNGIGTAAVFGNFVVLKIFSSFPALRTPANMLVMNLAFSDFCLMLSLFPEMVYNFFLGGNWQFGEMACQIHAFLGKLQFNSFD